jgi:hypothetical protein
MLLEWCSFGRLRLTSEVSELPTATRGNLATIIDDPHRNQFINPSLAHRDSERHSISV